MKVRWKPVGLIAAGDPYALLFGNTVAPFAVTPLPSGFTPPSK